MHNQCRSRLTNVLCSKKSRKAQVNMESIQKLVAVDIYNNVSLKTILSLAINFAIEDDLNATIIQKLLLQYKLTFLKVHSHAKICISVLRK